MVLVIILDQHSGSKERGNRQRASNTSGSFEVLAIQSLSSKIFRLDREFTEQGAISLRFIVRKFIYSSVLLENKQKFNSGIPGRLRELFFFV